MIGHASPVTEWGVTEVTGRIERVVRRRALTRGDLVELYARAIRLDNIARGHTRSPGPPVDWRRVNSAIIARLGWRDLSLIKLRAGRLAARRHRRRQRVP